MNLMGLFFQCTLNLRLLDPSNATFFDGVGVDQCTIQLSSCLQLNLGFPLLSCVW